VSRVPRASFFRACFGTPAQIWSRDEHDKRELTKEFMFFALPRKGINAELPEPSRIDYRARRGVGRERV
jgi:hypothetical protein